MKSRDVVDVNLLRMVDIALNDGAQQLAIAEARMSPSEREWSRDRVRQMRESTAKARAKAGVR